LLLGLLVGTVLYIIGGYFLPFLCYAVFMLAITPFAARLIPSKPAMAKTMVEQTEKNCEDDVEIKIADETVTDQVKAVAMTTGQPKPIKKKGINPFKIVYRLMKNKVSIIVY
jgi:hypothetical protein